MVRGASKTWRGLGLALFVFVLCIVRYYAWAWFTPDLQFAAWKAGSAIMILGLLWALWQRGRSVLFGMVAIWLAIEETQVLVCNVWYIADPWPLPPDVSMCSVKAGIDVGALTLLLAALLLRKIIHAYVDWRIHERRRTQPRPPRP